MKNAISVTISSWRVRNRDAQKEVTDEISTYGLLKAINYISKFTFLFLSFYGTIVERKSQKKHFFFFIFLFQFPLLRFELMHFYSTMAGCI